MEEGFGMRQREDAELFAEGWFAVGKDDGALAVFEALEVVNPGENPLKDEKKVAVLF